MPLPADAAEAVITEAEEARQRRRSRRAEARRQRQAALDQKAAEQRELDRAAELRDAAGGSVPGCSRSRRGRRHCLPCVLTLVLSAMLHGKAKLAGITAWIAHAGQEALAAAGARAGRDGRLQALSRGQ